MKTLRNLREAEANYADDLVSQIDYILNPDSVLIRECNSWLNSRMKICAVALIIKQLHKLEQPDLVSISMSYLNSHFDFLKG